MVENASMGDDICDKIVLIVDNMLIRHDNT